MLLSLQAVIEQNQIKERKTACTILLTFLRVSGSICHCSPSNVGCGISLGGPWNFLKEHSSIVCFTVCFRSPQLHDGDSGIAVLYIFEVCHFATYFGYSDL